MKYGYLPFPLDDRYDDLLYSAVNRRCLRILYFHYTRRDIQRADDWLRRFHRISGVHLTLGQALRLSRRIPAFLEEHEYKISNKT